MLTGPPTTENSSWVFAVYLPSGAATCYEDQIIVRVEMAFLTSWQMKHRQDFFQPLLPESAVIFDVGANVGEHTAAFLSCGARKVISIEPQPDLCAHLEAVFSRSIREGKVVIRRNAVGSAPGTLKLSVSADRGRSMSTLSPLFLEISKRNGDPWNEASGIDVAVITLDQLIGEFGRPDYIKIDVEGYDLEVLKGLRSSVPLVSFEYNTQPGLIDVASSCIQRVSELGDYEFNIQAEAPDLAFLQLRTWVSADVIDYILRHDIARATRYGDIFCRLRENDE